MTCLQLQLDTIIVILYSLPHNAMHSSSIKLKVRNASPGANKPACNKHFVITRVTLYELLVYTIDTLYHVLIVLYGYLEGSENSTFAFFTKDIA